MGSSKIVASQGLTGNQSPISENVSTHDDPPPVKSSNGRSFTDSTRACSSLSAHIVTALVLAILVGTAVATFTYFLTDQNIFYTTLAGLGGFVITGLVAYGLMHVCLSVSKTSLLPVTEELSHF